MFQLSGCCCRSKYVHINISGCGRAPPFPPPPAMVPPPLAGRFCLEPWWFFVLTIKKIQMSPSAPPVVWLGGVGVREHHPLVWRLYLLGDRKGLYPCGVGYHWGERLANRQPRTYIHIYIYTCIYIYICVHVCTSVDLFICLFIYANII